MNRASGKSLIFLFFIWPLLALIYALKNIKLSWSKNIIWAFVAFYGFTMVISGDEETGIDSLRYRKKFIEMSKTEMTLQQFSDIFYDEEEGVLDIVQPLISFLVSRFTSDYHIFFCVLGVVFGFFYSRNIWFLLKFKKKDAHFVSVILLLSFAFIIGFWNINGFRFWTAAHVFIWSVTSYYFDKKPKYLLAIFCSFLIHFSFLFPIAIFLMFSLIGKRPTAYFYVFLLTFFVTVISSESLSSFLSDNLPSLFQKRANLYLNEDYKNNVSEQIQATNWYIKYYFTFIQLPITILVIYLHTNYRKIFGTNQQLASLFNFTLLFGAFSNVASLIPSGGRFLSLTYILFTGIVFIVVQFSKKHSYIKRLILYTSPLFFLFIIISFRLSLDTMNISLIFSNPLLAIFLNLDIAIINLIK